MTDVVLGMSALVDKPGLAHRNLRQIETLNENAGRGGTSMLALVATVVQRNTFFRAKLEVFFFVVCALKVAVPMLCTLKRELDELGDASAIEAWAGALKAAADVVCYQAKHVVADVIDTF